MQTVHELDPATTAAVPVDVQNDYLHEDGGLLSSFGFDPAVPQAAVGPMAEFLERWRARGLDVVHVRSQQSERTDSRVWTSRFPETDLDICDPGSWGGEFYSPIDPDPGEAVVDKHRYSGFAGTSLDLVLRSSGIDSLVVFGAVSYVCVAATAREAFNRDYTVVVPEDCCSYLAEQADFHETFLETFDTFYGDVTTTDGVYERLAEA